MHAELEMKEMMGIEKDMGEERVEGQEGRVAGEDETEGNQQAERERGAGYWKEQEMVHEIGDTLLELHRATTEPLRVLARGL